MVLDFGTHGRSYVCASLGRIRTISTWVKKQKLLPFTSAFTRGSDCTEPAAPGTEMQSSRPLRYPFDWTLVLMARTAAVSKRRVQYSTEGRSPVTERNCRRRMRKFGIQPVFLMFQPLHIKGMLRAVKGSSASSAPRCARRRGSRCGIAALWCHTCCVASFGMQSLQCRCSNAGSATQTSWFICHGSTISHHARVRHARNELPRAFPEEPLEAILRQNAEFLPELPHSRFYQG